MSRYGACVGHPARIAVAGLIWLAAGLLCAAQNLNPCVTPQPGDIQEGKGFVIGLAYWPGGTIEDWGNVTAGLHPCYDAAGTLTAQGVEIAAYEVKVDTMALLRTSRFTESRLFEAAEDGSRPPVLSVIAFAGEYRSEARYIWSDDAALTQGTGVAGSLTLIADFDKGKLRYLRWQNVGCGCDDAQCLVTTQPAQEDLAESRACASNSVAECRCGADAGQCANPADDPFRCHTAFQVATSGTDEDSKVLKTGVQLQRINSLSLTNLYNNAVASGSDLINSVREGAGNFFG